MTFAARQGRVAAAAAPARARAAAESGTAVDGAQPRRFVGLVTRALAFALDAAVINAIAIVTGAVVALAFSVVTIPHELRTAAAAVGGVLYIAWTVGYFVVFWATTGQTPASRLVGIRVGDAADGRLGPWRALLRFAGLTLAALPFFAGFALILFDDRRRGLHDRLARTVVVEAAEEGAAAAHPPRRSGAAHK